MDRGAWWTILHEVIELATTERLHTHAFSHPHHSAEQPETVVAATPKEQVKKKKKNQTTSQHADLFSNNKGYDLQVSLNTGLDISGKRRNYF